MAVEEGPLGAYVFQGPALLVPEGIADAQASRPLPLGLAPEAGERCVIPPLEGEGALTGVMLGAGEALPKGWRGVPVRQALAASARGMVGAGSPEALMFRAYHVMQWRRESAYCGSCGSPNQDSPKGLSRVCPACGRTEFPRISPAVIVLVTNDRDEALLAHNANFMGHVYSLIAGFVEAGENLESAVRREIREEVNIEVDGIRYAASQPWPFPNSLMLGFTAKYAGGELRPDGTEILEAGWFARDAPPDLPGNGSVARLLIERWLAYRPEGE
jgi:NAD+ diphosphatase